MCVAISESAMDKCKVYATLQVETVKSTDNPTENVDSLGSYTQVITVWDLLKWSVTFTRRYFKLFGNGTRQKKKHLEGVVADTLIYANIQLVISHW